MTKKTRLREHLLGLDDDINIDVLDDRMKVDNGILVNEVAIGIDDFVHSVEDILNKIVNQL